MTVIIYRPGGTAEKWTEIDKITEQANGLVLWRGKDRAGFTAVDIKLEIIH